MTEKEMSVHAALAIICSPDPFFPETFRAAAREKIKADGTEEQKKLLKREPSVRQAQANRLSSMTNNSGRLSNL